MKTPPKPTPTPLERQVGGSHYVSPAQHVSFCQRNRIPWCEAAAIKYIVRHRKKNGKQDLEKAVHYLELCCHEDYLLSEVNPRGMDPARFRMTLNTFFLGNAVPKAEAEAITLICSHHALRGESTLMDAIRILQKLIKEYVPVDDGTDLL